MPSVIRPSIECWLFAEAPNVNASVLLLQVATQAEHPAFWQPVTGGIEPGETPEQACRREVWEETGLVLEADAMVQLEQTFDVQVDRELTIHKTLFVAAAQSQQVQLSLEHVSWQWVPFLEAPELLYWPSNFETCMAVAQFLKA